MLHEQKANRHNILWFKVKQLMNDKKISQAELARRAGVNKTVISALKLGQIKKPSFELMCKLADGLNVDINEFREE